MLNKLDVEEYIISLDNKLPIIINQPKFMIQRLFSIYITETLAKYVCLDISLKTLELLIYDNQIKIKTCIRKQKSCAG